MDFKRLFIETFLTGSLNLIHHYWLSEHKYLRFMVN